MTEAREADESPSNESLLQGGCLSLPNGVKCQMAGGLVSLVAVSLAIAFVPAWSDPISEAYLPQGFSLQVFSSGHGRTRGLHALPNGDVLLVKAVSRGASADDSAIILLWDDDADGIADGQLQLVGPGHGLSHGIEYIKPENNEGTGMLLASSDTTVFSWAYTHGQRSSSLGSGNVIVSNMNARSDEDDLGAFRGHWTRTLRLSPGDQRYLYISVGSAGNIDADSYRSRIRRFDLSTANSSFEFSTGEVFADGLRNEVGLAFDSAGILWGVENGADRLQRTDLGGDIHNDNPAEELNRFDGPVGTHYGYPWCWSEYILPEEYGMGRGTVWAWPSTMNTFRNDAWCRAETRAAALSMQAHSAPLGIIFFDRNSVVNGPFAELCSTAGGSFPQENHGDAYVGFHGSWNRDVPTGYKVVHLPFESPGGSPTGDVGDLLRHDGSAARWPSGVRPVDVVFDRCGRLLVSDDGTGSIFTISYNIQPVSNPVVSAVPSALRTSGPSVKPTMMPNTSASPSSNPTVSEQNSSMSSAPTYGPANPIPSAISSIAPTYEPTGNPSRNPTTQYSPSPSSAPTNEPTVEPLVEPTEVTIGSTGGGFAGSSNSGNTAEGDDVPESSLDTPRTSSSGPSVMPATGLQGSTLFVSSLFLANVLAK